MDGVVLNLRPKNLLKSYALEGICICALFSKGLVKRGWSTPTFERTEAQRVWVPQSAKRTQTGSPRLLSYEPDAFHA